ncbi:MAG TPA: M48 family metalloprotease [Alphaproteobacteria bacterium]|nr:M48 family metalloprotease [Alphaproteobacteria bacterium]
MTFAPSAILGAVVLRPNAIDHRVDALSSHMLLTHSAAQLVDPDRQVAALRLVHWYLPGWFLAVLLPALALAYYWNSGRAAGVRDALRRRFHNEMIVRFAFGAMLGLVVRLADVLPDFYLYRVARAMSQNDQLLRSWGADWLLVTLVWMLAIGLVTAAVLWLVDRTHQWYLYTIVAILAVSFGLTYLAPFGSGLFERVAPMPARSVPSVREVEGLAHENVPVVEVVRERSHVGTAYVSGLGGSQRIVIGDVIFAVTSPQELEYVLARELGYIANGAQWKMALTDGLLLIFGAAFAVAIADRIGFRRDDDPVSRFALVGALFSVLYLIAVPVDNAVLRALARGADHYALALPIDRAVAVRNVVRATDESLTEVCPDVLARLFLERSEDPAVRISEINGVPSTCPQ